MQINVLIIDDGEDSLEVFEEFLDTLGIKVIGKAKNGKEAVTAYKRLKPDIVLMDIVMPEYDGFYGCEKIKEADPLAKIVMVTGYHDENMEQKLLSMGAYAIIYKPYDSKTVLTILDKVRKGERLVAQR